MGQTVNLVAQPSQVRILLPPLVEMEKIRGSLTGLRPTNTDPTFSVRVIDFSNHILNLRV